MKLMQFSSLLVVSVCVAATAPSERAAFEVRKVQETPNAETEPLRLIQAVPSSEQTQGDLIHVVKAPLMDWRSVSSASAGADTRTGKTYIEFVFTTKGQQLFSAITRKHVKQQLAIVADGTVLSAPVINEEIKGRHMRLTVPFSKQEAERIATKINKAIKK